MRSVRGEVPWLAKLPQKLVYKPLPQDDPMQRRPDITLARKLLKWQPKVDRAEGLKITYAYFQGLSKAEDALVLA